MMRALMTKTLFVLSILLSAQALAFDVDGLSYTILNGTDVEVTGRASGNTATDIVIPATVDSNSTTTYSVTTIGDSVFANNSLNGAFEGNALTSVIIPDSVTTIGGFAFRSNALTSVIIPDSVTTIGGFAFAENALTSVIIGNSVKTIGVEAFDGNALTSVIIPDSVETIEDGAFRDNALTSVIIPDSVTTIGVEAFYNNALTSAAFKGNFGSFDLDMFPNNLTLATITYCDGTVGWPQGFNNGSTIVVTEPVNCSPVAPDAPQITNIEPGNAQVSISVSVANDGGSPITGYNAYCFGDTFYFGVNPTSPITVLGLTNGVSYVCAVSAENDKVTSTLSAVSAPVTPVAPPPGC